MSACVEDHDAIRRFAATIRSETVGGYCQRRDTGSTVGCWCIGVGINGQTNANCPPETPPALEAADVPDQERALPWVTPVPWFPKT